MPHHLAQATFEPCLSVTRLPACPACGDKHPLAYNPPRPPATCPNCGGPALPSDPTQTVAAELIGGGVAIRVGRVLLAAGRFLNRFAE